MSVSSYAALFRDQDDDGLGLVGIQIPMIQRDYAQGREDQKASRIRNDFIDTLWAAVEPDPTGAVTQIGLDFVYGDVRQGVLLPLDGQQRLTALFLLHWYLAVRSGGTDAPWLTFTYETRASARQFCEELRKAALPGVPTEGKPDFADQQPSQWIEDQSWFMPGWTSEPTIASMLVVLDSMHARFADVDAEAALARLTDRFRPAIEFHVLDLKDMKLDNDIYVRMNSRGKPLTDFEIFKARFGKTLEMHFPDRAREFAQRIDGVWLDAFWSALATPDGQPIADGQIDAAILRYMRFLADFVDAREGGRIAEGDSEADVCLRVFGDEASDTRLDWLFRAFDLWTSADVSCWFATHFRDARVAAIETDPRLPLFDPGRNGANLFLACCKDYSPERHKTEFPARLALLLYAILISGRATDAVTMRRLRVVRNLADWSVDEIRPENMGRLLEQTEQVMAGVIPDSTGFNVSQMEDERRKAEVLEQNPLLEPVLHTLEDHDFLRGRLLAFALDPQLLPIHANAFARAFGKDMNHDSVAAALLAADDYTDRGYVVRRLVPARQHDRRWREVLTGTLPRSTNSPVTRALSAVLTCVSETEQAPDAHLEASLLRPFLTARSSVCWFDWRYYFVAYQSMRESAQGCYSPAKEDGAVRMGYVVRRHNNVEWAYRDTDPYLDAVCAKVDERMANRLTREQTELMETGQWLRLDGIGITVASRQDGWRIFLPVEHPANIEVQSVFSAFGVQQCVNENDADETDSSVFWHLPISQSDSVPEGIDPPGMREVSLVDREDRVQRAADFISALLHATMGVVTAARAEGEVPNEAPIL
jgi:hypothetical protein